MKALLFLILGCLLIGCSSSKEIVAPTVQSKMLDTWVSQKDFRIESTWAYPQVTSTLNSLANSGLLPPASTINAINLLGNNNHFEVHGDSIAMYLPYFGEQQIAQGYNNRDISIHFNGSPDLIEITKDERTQSYKIKYRIKSKREAYRVFITLHPNLTSDITINSNFRTPISYRGEVSKLPKNNNTTITKQ